MKRKLLRILSVTALGLCTLIPLASCDLDFGPKTGETTSNNVKLTLITKSSDGVVNSTFTQTLEKNTLWKGEEALKPSVDGYTFKGWYLDENYIYKTQDVITISVDTVLFGKMEADDNTKLRNDFNKYFSFSKENNYEFSGSNSTEKLIFEYNKDLNLLKFEDATLLDYFFDYIPKENEEAFSLCKLNYIENNVIYFSIEDKMLYQDFSK